MCMQTVTVCLLHTCTEGSVSVSADDGEEKPSVEELPREDETDHVSPGKQT